MTAGRSPFGRRSNAFAELLGEAHGLDAEPWHDLLRRQVVGDRWPDRCSLPPHWNRGPLIDLAIEAFASNPERSPRRVVVVHREAPVLDGLRRHAERLAGALKCPKGPATTALAERLRSITGGTAGDPPLRVAVVPDSPAIDLSWTMRTRDALVLIATLEQVGSALLFRSIAGSPQTAPMHAGLIGVDALLLLLDVEPDEPFHRTIADLRDLPGESLGPANSVRIDASPVAIEGLREFRPEASEIVALGPAKVPVRIECRLVELAPGADLGNAMPRAAAIAEMVEGLIREGARRVGVFCDPRRDRRMPHALLDAVGRLATTIDAISPGTAVDRGHLGARLRSSVAGGSMESAIITLAGDNLASTPVPLFDAIVFEIDSPERMLRRIAMGRDLGRDRAEVVALRFAAPRGRGRPPRPTAAESLAMDRWRRLERIAREHRQRSDSSWSDAADPTGRLWDAWCFETPSPTRTSGPRLLPPHLELLQHTSPTPDAEPEATRFVVAKREDVVWWCWRDDLPSPQASRREVERYLQLLPPTGAECRRVPRSALTPRITTASGAAAPPESRRAADETPTAGWLRHSDVLHVAPWRGISGRLRTPEDLRAGDIVLADPGRTRIPGWPEGVDVASSAWWLDLNVIRLRSEPPVTVEVPVGLDGGGVLSPGPRTPEVDDWLAALLRSARVGDSDRIAPGFRDACDDLRCGRRPIRVMPHPIRGWVLESQVRIPGRAVLATLDREFAGSAELGDRLRRVADRVAAEAMILGLPTVCAEALVRAARWHDLGDLDPSAPRRLEDGGIGRSMRTSGSPTPSSLASEDSCRPRDRHEGEESASGCPVETSGPPRPDVDELVRHLIATRRGWSRPLDPARRIAKEVDSNHEHRPLLTVDPSGPGRLRRLSRRFGPWGLALLETILRTADAVEHEAAKPWASDGVDS